VAPEEGGKVVPAKKVQVILGEPIYGRCWATDLSRKERGKVVPSKRVRLSHCELDFPGGLYANGLGRVGMRKSGSFENSMALAGGA
jgi:hypothetical protein